MSELIQGMEVLLYGAIIIVVALAIMILCLNLLGRVLNMGKKKTAPTSSEPIPEPHEYPQLEIVEDDPQEEIAAVISAALAICLSQGNTRPVIRSIRRAGTSVPAWSAAGREEQVWNRY